MKKVAQTVIVADRFYMIANASGKVIVGVEGEANGAAIQVALDMGVEWTDVCDWDAR